MRAIDADKLIRQLCLVSPDCDEFGRGVATGISAAIQKTADTPTITLDDLRPKGRWVMRGGKRYCSHCGERACVTRDKEDFWYTTSTKFCSECGADMRGGGKDG